MTPRELKQIVAELESGLPRLSCGYVYTPVAELIRGLVMFYRPDLVIHTGFLWGKSSAYILDALDSIKESDSKQESDKKFNDFVESRFPKRTEFPLLISIDPNMFGINTDRQIEILQENYVTRFVFIREKSEDYFSKVINYMQENIMGIVDGDHTEKGCMNDLLELHRLGAKTILVDDTSWIPELDTVCRTFANTHKYTYYNFSDYNGLGVLIRDA